MENLIVISQRRYLILKNLKLRKDYQHQIVELQTRMREIQFALYKRKIPLVLVFGCMDVEVR